jgi:hypothetical protein
MYKRFACNVAGLAAVGVIASAVVIVGAPAPAKAPAAVAALPVAPKHPAHRYEVFDALPPLEYDHPYTGALEVRRLNSQDKVRAACPASMQVPLGCSWLWAKDNRCLIIMADDATIRAAGWDPDVVWRHEVGHCNSWSPDHEGARPNSAPAAAPVSMIPKVPGCPTEKMLSVGCFAEHQAQLNK